MARVLVAALIAGVVAAPLSSQEPREGAAPRGGTSATVNPYNGRLGQLNVQVPKLTGAVRVDGKLDEAVWGSAAMLTGFSQYAPVDRVAAEDSTEVLVMYSDHEMYFGVRSFEPHGTVVASLADRDKIGGNDHVQLLLDTFNDRRRALVFSMNPLGVQSDGTFSDGSGYDLNPDFQLLPVRIEGPHHEYGYEIEIRITFKSIRYQQTAVQQWGVQVIRRVMHSGHEQTWTAAERGANYYVERHDPNGAVRDTVPYSGTDRLTNIGVMLRLGTPQWKQFSGNAEVLGGQDDNFDEWSSAWILYSTIEANWQPRKRGSTDVSWNSESIARAMRHSCACAPFPGSSSSTRFRARYSCEWSVNSTAAKWTLCATTRGPTTRS